MSKSNKSSPPIRICFPFVGSTMGGSHLSTLLLIENLDRNRFEPLVVLHEEGQLSNYLNEHGAPYTLLPLKNYIGAKPGILNNIVLLIQIIFILVNFLWKNRISIVHTQDARMHYSWAIPARLAGCKFIWHQRAIFYNTGLMKVLIRFSHQVVCISQYVLSSYPYGATSKFRIINNPFSANQLNLSRTEYKKKLVEQLGLEDDCSLVGFCGNLVEQKRPVFFVEMAAKILASYSKPVAFVMVGADRNGMSDQIVASLKQLNIEHRFHLLGFISPIEQVLAAFDVLAAPAVKEGFGRTLVESMIVGTPVVAADSGGHSEIMHNCPLGVLAAVDDVDDFSNSILGLLDNPDSIDIARKESLDKIYQLYSIENHVEQIMNLYDDSIAS